MEKRKRENGVTLLGLVVTVIVLLILAGVTVSLTIGESGIITKAQQAKDVLEKSTIIEAIRIVAMEKEFEFEYYNYSYVDYLKEKGIIDQSSAKVDMGKLQINISKGNGSWSKGDVYQIVGSQLYYFNKKLEKELIGELWADHSYLEFSYDRGEITGLKKDESGNYIGPEDIVIPEKIEQVKVLAIHDGAFSKISGLKSVSIKAPITTIPDYCFNESPDLNKIELPNTVTTIKIGAFKGTNLREFNIPSSVITMEDKLFRDCTNLEKVALLNNVTELPAETFYNCSNLKEITLNSEIKIIQTEAFINVIV